MRTEKSLYEQIRDTGELPDDLAEKLNAEIEKFTNGFNIQDETGTI
jgi:F0F1-type ATP synthase alpha subunit